ncbi:c-type cytochrome [Flavihumibacter petaseus]|uniref:Putative cytochrome c n=1 Tax=Flavihumibacter petaseus NBRC 106054 TaxID=1220578 RepID=A0A0E9N314_9BACT|nr:c-type cytochrome [Flavihumibacter petaseus]GAO44224.1 putative cytochrome c [Flavihumibacter petaseus NBRC 106054]
MKKYVLLAGISAFAIACGSGGSEKTGTDSASAAKTEQPAAAPADDKAIELIAANDCLTCHKVNEKAIGPSYTDVAKKYEASDAVVHDLSSKIIKGGSGVWGTVPMTPHPQLSEADAQTMVKYILTLKNQ